jgi:hypothetical protein
MKNRVKPTLEVLHDRIVPATLLWIGPNGGSWSQQNNWIDQSDHNFVPQNGDTLIFDPNQTFSGKQGTSTRNTDDISGLQLASMEVNSGFGAVITLSQNLLLGNGQGASNLSGGTLLIDNTTAGQSSYLEITRGSSFAWNGGSLVNGLPTDIQNHTRVSDLKIDPNASLYITGAATDLGLDLVNSGTVYFGPNSDVVLKGNYAAIENYGTFDIDNNQGIQPTPPQFVDPGWGFHNYSTGDLEKVGGTGQSTIATVFLNEGTFGIQSGTVYLSGTSQRQFSGSTVIDAGCTLGTNATYVVSGGIMSGSAGTSTLTGNLEIDGGTFYVGGQQQPGQGRFVVTNNYTQTGGTTVITVNNSGTTLTNDQLDVGNQANLGGTLTVYTMGQKPANPVVIMYYTHLVNNFAAFTWNPVQYTPDTTSNANEYQLT